MRFKKLNQLRDVLHGLMDAIDASFPQMGALDVQRCSVKRNKSHIVSITRKKKNQLHQNTAQTGSMAATIVLYNKMGDLVALRCSVKNKRKQCALLSNHQSSATNGMMVVMTALLHKMGLWNVLNKHVSQ